VDERRRYGEGNEPDLLPQLNFDVNTVDFHNLARQLVEKAFKLF
jgi:hypothetical protein